MFLRLGEHPDGPRLVPQIHQRRGQVVIGMGILGLEPDCPLENLHRIGVTALIAQHSTERREHRHVFGIRLQLGFEQRLRLAIVLCPELRVPPPGVDEVTRRSDGAHFFAPRVATNRHDISSRSFNTSRSIFRMRTSTHG